MTHQEVLAAVKNYLALFEQSLAPEEREAALRVALDQLALASHYAHAPFDEQAYPAPPAEDYNALRERIGPQFPELGFYNVAGDIDENVGTSEVHIADALDDIVDIARDLQAVAHRWATTSEANALWHFRFSFRTHWGEHLRSLQLYLHQRVHWTD